MQETINLPLVIGMNRSRMRSHTGAMMSLGVGLMCTISRMQKLNSTSSTEAELGWGT
jgi:hypothetical protein